MLKIFEVKVYPYSPEIFDRKVNKKIGEILEKNPNYPSMLMYTSYHSKGKLEDYIVGYIDVFLDGSEVVYEARLMVSERQDKQYFNQELKKIESLHLYMC